MSRTNKSRSAVLVLLSLGPRSGYDIERDIKRSIGHFWNESFGQIYPALRALVADGLATVDEEPQQGRPNRKVYTITEAGRAALGTWLESPPEPPPVRHELLLKLFVGWETSPDTVRAHLTRFRDHFDREQRMFEVYRRVLGDQAEEHPDALFWLMTLRSGQLATRARLQWCEEALEMLDRIEAFRNETPTTTEERRETMTRLLQEAYTRIEELAERAAAPQEVGS